MRGRRGATPRRRPAACSSACRRCALADVAALAAAIDAGLRAGGSPERAVQEKRYLKSALDHYGASMPTIQRVVRTQLRAAGDLDHDAVRALVEMLWRPHVHESRMAAVEILEASVAVLTAADLPLLEQLLREARTWALVDPLAASVVGVVGLHDARVGTVLDVWVRDSDFWVRRASLLALLPGVRQGSPDLVRMQRFADTLLEEREFFIRKAIGWVLRELGAREPEWVVAFLEPRLTRAAGLTVREAVKRLPADERERLLAARAG